MSSRVVPRRTWCPLATATNEGTDHGRARFQRPPASLSLLDGDDSVRESWGEFVADVTGKLRERGWTNCTQLLGGWLAVTIFLDHRVDAGTARTSALAYAKEKREQHPEYDWLVISEGAAPSLSIDLVSDVDADSFLNHFCTPPPAQRDGSRRRCRLGTP